MFLFGSSPIEMIELFSLSMINWLKISFCSWFLSVSESTVDSGMKK